MSDINEGKYPAHFVILAQLALCESKIKGMRDGKGIGPIELTVEQIVAERLVSVLSDMIIPEGALAETARMLRALDAEVLFLEPSRTYFMRFLQQLEEQVAGHSMTTEGAFEGGD